MEFALKILLAYLLGSIVGSLVVGRLRGGVDIRKLGSGNAGGTNALRTQGPAFAIWVILIDIAKGWVAAALLPGFALPAVAPAPPTRRVWLPPVCGFAAILGHVFPVWHGFRGGKGVATLVGAFAGIELAAAAAAVCHLARRGDDLGVRRPRLDRRGVRHPCLSTDA